ncbi:hypothetical protein D6789_02250 [Candidatus Woesearchaeota archaeon]|nr:MAG: hypothetical protein D6789_02250 [Candidatus Woesearchaeota archaeon]
MVTKKAPSFSKAALAAALTLATAGVASAGIDEVKLTTTDASGRATTYAGVEGELHVDARAVDLKDKPFTEPIPITEQGCLTVAVKGDVPTGERIDYRLIDPNEPVTQPLEQLFHDEDDIPIPPLSQPAFATGKKLCLTDIIDEEGTQRFTAGDVFLVSVRQESIPSAGRPSRISASAEYLVRVNPEPQTPNTPREPVQERPAQRPKLPSSYRQEKGVGRGQHRDALKTVSLAVGREARTESWVDECTGPHERDGNGGAWIVGFEYLGDRIQLDASYRSLRTTFAPEWVAADGAPVPPVVVTGSRSQLVVKGDYRLWDGTFSLGIPFGGAYVKSTLIVDDPFFGYGPDEVEVGSGPSLYAGAELIIAPRGTFNGPSVRLGYIGRGEQMSTKFGDAWSVLGADNETTLQHGPLVGIHVPFGKHRVDLTYERLVGDAEGEEHFIEARARFGIFEGRRGLFQLGGRAIHWDRSLRAASWESDSNTVFIEGSYSW